MYLIRIFLVCFPLVFILSCNKNLTEEEKKELWSKAQTTGEIYNRSGSKLPNATSAQKAKAMRDAETRLSTGGGLFGQKGLDVFGVINNPEDGGVSGGVVGMPVNPYLWRASLETIDFMPLLTVDYAGGLIITDWYSDGSSNESIKITIKFLDTEVRVDAMIIDIHKKICNNSNNCSINKIDTKLNFEIRDKILKKAAVYAKDLKERINKDRPKKLYPGDAGPDKY